MSRRALLALAAAVSAFVLILAGAAASYALRPAPSPATAATESVPASVVRAREAELRRLIDEANARIRAQQAAIAAAPSPETTPVATRSFERDDDDDRPHGRHERRHAHHEDNDG
jgi:hypothetical protein